MDYLGWNERIAKYFFNEEMSGKEVILYATKEIIESIGENEGNLNSFIECIKQGPPWITRHYQGLCIKAYQTFKNWRSRPKSNYPPYIAYLVLFILAEDTEGDFAPHAYYPRLRKLLGEPAEKGMLPSFDKMWELWMDLETWSKEDKNEEVGHFKFRIRGHWVHVGLPLSQTLLSNDERQKLPLIFSDADLDPTDIPSTQTIKKLLLLYGEKNSRLTRRTLRLLRSDKQENTFLKEALLEFVIDELSEWDGTVEEVDPERSLPASKLVKIGLRICFKINSFAQTLETALRFKSNKSFPEEELNFRLPGNSTILSCTESVQSWSSPLINRQEMPSKIFDATEINWNEEITLIDDENSWKVKFIGKTTRVFLSGSREGLPGWIEASRLERNTSFYIACTGKDTGIIEEWGKNSCEAFEKIQIMKGLPPEWVLFRGKNAFDPCYGIDVLSISSYLRLLFKGGIKTGRGNKYLSFAPPNIVVENSSGKEEILLNSRKLQRKVPDSNIYEIPPKLPLNQSLQIVLKQNNHEIKRNFQLSEPELPLAYNSLPCRNQMGFICRDYNSNPVSSGVKIHNYNEQNSGEYPKLLPTHLSSRIIFVGPNPGEIVDWPHEELPTTWTPVWAIVKLGKKKWEAYFCGSSGQGINKYKSGNLSPERALRKRWREALWVNRRITEPPALQLLKKRWDEYLKAAKNVK